jgi:agmatinase
LNPSALPSNNFLGLPSEFSRLDKSEFVILPVPYEETTTYRTGTKNAPPAILAASQEVETFDEELEFEAYPAGICTLDQMEVTASGPKKMIKRVNRAIGELISKEKRVVMLGGEHTISIGAVEAFKEKFPRLSVLQMDAHADLRDSYQDNRYSHACVMRRIGELTGFVGLGIRNISQEEYGLIKQNRDMFFLAQDIRTDNRWKEKVLEKLGPDVYLTLDLDVLDPSIMPAVGTPEPGGLLWYETLEFLKKLVDRKNIVGFDLVELCPIPGFVAPDFLAARLIYKIITYMVNKERGSQGQAG